MGIYQKTFIDVPHNTWGMIKCAWVGGSIWGEIIAGILTLMMIVKKMRNDLNIRSNF